MAEPTGHADPNANRHYTLPNHADNTLAPGGRDLHTGSARDSESTSLRPRQGRACFP
ncbi:hypothetical protein GCM10026982_55020 [Nocardiopsis aegyptia]